RGGGSGRWPGLAGGGWAGTGWTSRRWGSCPRVTGGAWRGTPTSGARPNASRIRANRQDADDAKFRIFQMSGLGALGVLAVNRLALHLRRRRAVAAVDNVAPVPVRLLLPYRQVLREEDLVAGRIAHRVDGVADGPAEVAAARDVAERRAPVQGLVRVDELAVEGADGLRPDDDVRPRADRAVGRGVGLERHREVGRDRERGELVVGLLE